MDTATSAHRDKVKGEEGYIFIVDEGTGDLPIVFTHSSAGNTTHWKNQLAFFRPTRRVIAFDFRGHGKSEASPTSRYTPEALANDIVAVVDSLDLEKFILVGHSMGGSAAVAYADTHANRVAALVLVGTPGNTPDEISKPVMESLRSDAYDKVMSQHMEEIVAGARPEVAEAVRVETNKLSKEASIGIIQGLFEFEALDKVKRYSGPKLIIVSGSDEKQPNSLHNQVTGVPVKVIEGASHWVQLDQPEDFNRILDDFLRKLKQHS
jgi:pimeloyl-ACP methyl ester carboxylesterase